MVATWQEWQEKTDDVVEKTGYKPNEHYRNGEHEPDTDDNDDGSADKYDAVDDDLKPVHVFLHFV